MEDDQEHSCIANGRSNIRTCDKWDKKYDPFQVFKVDHELCISLEVKVKNGKDITKGSFISDFFDTPDSYIKLEIPGSLNATKRTSTKDNTVHPMWDQSFQFFLNPRKKHKLKITLMDGNYVIDEQLAVLELDVNSIPLDSETNECIEFANNSKVYLSLKRQKITDPNLRYSLALCEDEKKFLRKRRANVFETMNKMLEKKAPENYDHVPVIAVMGSGGGLRAMVSLSGAVKALQESEILDCVTYISGLSGSSWYISTLYAHDDFPNVTYEDIYDELQKSVTENWKWYLAHSYKYIIDMYMKQRGGQSLSVTDFFGHLLGDVLLHGKKNKKLSDQRKIVELGTVPFPLYTCIHAKDSVPCKTFSEWIEFSPYEIGMSKYGTFMDTEDFGSKFLFGKLIKNFPEYPLHYLQGVWGSAFTEIVFSKSGNSKHDLTQIMENDEAEQFLNEHLKVKDLNEQSKDSFSHEEVETDEEEEGDTDDNSSETEKQKTQNETTESVTKIINETTEDEECKYRKNSIQSKPETGGQPIHQESNMIKGKSSEQLPKGNCTQMHRSYIQAFLKKISLAGNIPNPLRGLCLKKTVPFSPLEIKCEDKVDSRYKELDTEAKKLCIGDAGLAFNSPYPLLLRPQRAVDIYLSFDFSGREFDRHTVFEQLLLAEEWAFQNKIRFPSIKEQIAEFSVDDEVKELYVFKNDTDPYCPVVLHFPLVNNKFKSEKAPGVPRETEEEKNFANFSVFDKPTPFDTWNFTYDPLSYERLVKLVEYNTLLGVEEIKNQIALMVQKKKNPPDNISFREAEKVIEACKIFKSKAGFNLRVDDVEYNKYMKSYKKNEGTVDQG